MSLSEGLVAKNGRNDLISPLSTVICLAMIAEMEQAVRHDAPKTMGVIDMFGENAGFSNSGYSERGNIHCSEICQKNDKIDMLKS